MDFEQFLLMSLDYWDKKQFCTKTNIYCTKGNTAQRKCCTQKCCTKKLQHSANAAHRANLYLEMDGLQLGLGAAEVGLAQPIQLGCEIPEERIRKGTEDGLSEPTFKPFYWQPKDMKSKLNWATQNNQVLINHRHHESFPKKSKFQYLSKIFGLANLEQLQKIGATKLRLKIVQTSQWKITQQPCCCPKSTNDDLDVKRQLPERARHVSSEIRKLQKYSGISGLSLVFSIALEK